MEQRELEERWDCETIVSTYSNLDNHPGLLGQPNKPRRRGPRTPSEGGLEGVGEGEEEASKKPAMLIKLSKK
jgi:hypothetical protein